MRAVARITGVSKDTVAKLLRDAGEACQFFHDDFVYDLHSQRIQCDEIWSFNYVKDKRLEKAKRPPEMAGSVWTWTAIDPDAKFIVSWLAGTRGTESANLFVRDLHSRLADRVQLTTDGHMPYVSAVERVFGGDVDFAQVVKEYNGRGHYTGSQVSVRRGMPRPKDVSTSLVERQNLTMRQSMRRFTRQTNGHSKKFEMHCNALALYFVWYNFVRPHMSLKGDTPAVAAQLLKGPLSWEWIIGMIDARNPTPKTRGPYKRRRELSTV